MQKLVLLELNEVIFPYVEGYIHKGHLPHFREILARCGYRTTDSEKSYAQLEPWIQWVSAHTGLTYDEHRVFRLGDIAGSRVRQIFEMLEERGVSIGAVSPMNAENRLRDAAFFIPDPWTRGVVTGNPDVVRLYGAISNAVNENSAGRLSIRDAMCAIEGLLRHGSLRNATKYVSLAFGSLGKPWRRALFLDLLLTDLFLGLWRRKKPDFGLLFLNAAAHVQHHYLYSSQCYSGPHKNPSWYVPAGADPLLEVYEIYDDILGCVLRLEPKPRLLVLTGLSQEPYPSPVYYYRLRNHASLLHLMKIPYVAIKTLMSRDFVIECASSEDAHNAQRLLMSAKISEGESVFEVENRGLSLFVALVYPNEISPGTCLLFEDGEVPDFDKHVVFVALKNGHHISMGYMVDSVNRVTSAETIPLTMVYGEVVKHFTN